MLGYQPVRQRVRLGTGDTLTFNPTLAIGDAQQLAAVDVRGRTPRGVGREAFEERRALGLGKFIDDTVLIKITGRRYGIPGTEVLLDPSRETASGLSKVCFASCYGLLLKDEALVGPVIGYLSAATIQQIEGCLKQVLAIP